MKQLAPLAALVGLAMTVLPAPARAADPTEITILCSNGLKAVVDDLAPKFERESKHKVKVTYGLAAGLKQQIEGGAPFDIAFLTPGAIDDLVKAGKIAAETKATIARSGLAIAIKAGARKRDVSTVDAFKRALLDAKGETSFGRHLGVAAYEYEASQSASQLVERRDPTRPQLVNPR